MSRRSLLRDTAGVSAVEFALLSPVFFLLMFAVIDAGQLVWTQMSLEHAVESAARCASLRSSNCATETQIQSYASAQAPGLGLPPSTFSYSTPGCGSQVTASFRYYFLSSAFPSSYTTLTATSCLPFASIS